MVQSGLTEPDIDRTWHDFLRNKVNSFIKWDLVRFFHDNPHTSDTADNIARYTGRDVKTIRRELSGLVESGVLQQHERGDTLVYELTDEKQMRLQIRDFVEACHNREFRVRAIHHVINGMRFTPQHDF